MISSTPPAPFPTPHVRVWLQILGVYFRSLPSAPTRVRDMLFESMRHALHVLREIAELNMAAKVRKRTRAGEQGGGVRALSLDQTGPRLCVF